VPHLHDGTFTVVANEDIPKILEELERLREYVAGKSELAWIAQRIDHTVATFESTDPAQWSMTSGSVLTPAMPPTTQPWSYLS
jgi:hypothetical protein